MISDLVLEDYLINGHNISRIVGRGISEDQLRKILREHGITVPQDRNRDSVTAAIVEMGYDSFDDFVKANQFSSIRDQARLLGVSRHALAKLHDTYRQYIVAKYSDRGRP